MEPWGTLTWKEKARHKPALQGASFLIMLEEGWETPCLTLGMTLDSALFFFSFMNVIF